MPAEYPVIPEKLFFKIGEVCELVGVQAHVLRYWETEFPTFSPQKNKSGQRSYRRKDVEVALKIKQLLYNEMFTIAGARKKLQSDAREASKPKVMPQVGTHPNDPLAPSLFDQIPDADEAVETLGAGQLSEDQRRALRTLASHLLDLRQMLNGGA